MYIARDLNLKEMDDFTKNVMPKLNQTNQALVVYNDDNITIGWDIVSRNDGIDF